MSFTQANTRWVRTRDVHIGGVGGVKSSPRLDHDFFLSQQLSVRACELRAMSENEKDKSGNQASKKVRFSES
jgi:hypothetical protein